MDVNKVSILNQYSIRKNINNISFQAGERTLLSGTEIVSRLLNPIPIFPEGSKFVGTDFAQHTLSLFKTRNSKEPVSKFLCMLKGIFNFENHLFSPNGEKISDVEILKNTSGEYFSYRGFPNGHIVDIQRGKLYRDNGSKYRVLDFKNDNRRFWIENLNVDDGIQCNLYGRTKEDGSSIMVAVDRDAKTGRLKSVEKTVCGRLASIYVPHVYYKDSSGSIKIKRMFGDYLGTFYEEDGSYYVFKRKSNRSNLIVEMYDADGIFDKKGTVTSGVNIVDELAQLKTRGEGLKNWLLDNVEV